MRSTRSYKFDDHTRQYKDKIRRNSGSISFSSLLILDRELVRPLKSSGLWGQIRRLNPCLGNDLTSSLVPLILISGSIIDTNNNLTSSDYSEATGWQTDGSTKYIDTGFALGTTTTSGMSAYLRTAQTNSATIRNVLMGCQDAANVQLFRLVSNTNLAGVVTSGATAGSLGGSNIFASTLTSGMTAGFWHVSRTSTTNVSLYKSGVSVNTTITSTTPAATTRTCWILGLNNGTLGLPLNSGSLVAGYCFDTGLNAADSMTLANIWQRFQIAMNRSV